MRCIRCPAYLVDMSRLLRSVRLVLHFVRRMNQRLTKIAATIILLIFDNECLDNQYHGVFGSRRSEFCRLTDKRLVARF